MGEESPGGVPEQIVVWDHDETDEDAGMEIHIEGKDVDVVCGAPALATSKFELQAFNFSEIFREKDWRDRRCPSVFLTPLDPAMWIFKSSFLISFWFVGIIW